MPLKHQLGIKVFLFALLCLSVHSFTHLSVKHLHFKMGLGASLFSKEVVPTEKAPPPSASSIKKKKKKDKNEDWRKAADAHKAQLLDPAYLIHPLRGQSVTAAAEYGPGTCEQECLMPGTHKHLGGAYDPTDGCIYGVPAHSKAVLCLYPVDHEDGSIEYKMTTIPLPDHIVDVRYKFLRGIIAHGYLWAIPSWANAVLCVDIDAHWGRRPANGDIVQLLPLPEDHPVGMPWQWHGAGINQEKTALYCIPASARHVLKVDMMTKTTSLIPVDVDEEKYPNFKMDLNNKWYGGIMGKDNACYGVPYRSCAVLRIDCNTDTAKLVGPDYGCAFFNWHGGVQVNGKIYAHPSHADTVLVIDTNPEKDTEISELAIHRAEYDKDPEKTYKWLGGNVGADGNIYCPACDTSSVLKIDTTTDICTTFGYTSTLKNKYQGGVYSARDKCIYSIPANGLHVLRIATDPAIEGEKPIQLIGDLPVSKDKWQGGHVGKDGCLYFIPENGYRVMKVTPPDAPPKIVNGKLPENDVKVELM
jgi:DNA-binding beta-propeller fold protein YncE